MRPVALLAVALLVTSPAWAAEVGQPAPTVSADRWINSEPTSLEALRGKVVLLEFWTFACFNCQNVEPALKSWHTKYKARGLEVLAIHTPEFDFERNPARLAEYVREQEIDYAVGVDNRARTWRRYRNRYWPTLYLIDRTGVLRHVRIGEGGYEETEAQIRALLEEPRPAAADPA
jgi:thiol-disulfide isomerase/thioredoxin